MWLMLAVIITAILGVAAYLDSRKPKAFPPGPPWLPVIGSALAVKKLRNELGGYLYLATAKLAQQYQGGCVGLRIGKDRVIVCVDFDAVKEMLKNEDFDGRPQGPFYETRTWGSRRGLILTDGEFWKEQKRFVLRHLREFGFGRKTMSGLVEDEVADLVNVFYKKVQGVEGGIDVEMSNTFSLHVLNTLWFMLAGVRYDTAEVTELQGLMSRLLASVDMLGAPFSQYPVLQYLAPESSGYNSFINTHKQLWKFLNAELQNHKATIEPGKPRDLMDVYLEELSSNDRKSSFSEDQLLAICLDMFVAGSETTSKSLGFCFLYLLLNPDVQRKAQREIDSVVGRGRAPSLDDRPNMPYNDAIVLEALRMFMGRTFSVPHRALRDATFCGYRIQKDSILIANFNRVLMSEEFWEEPEAFRPERFIKNGSIEVPEYYIPFGLGKHRCMGQSLARSNLFLFTSSLLQQFEFHVPVGQPPPSTCGVDGVTPSTGPYTATVKHRPFNHS